MLKNNWIVIILIVISTVSLSLQASETTPMDSQTQRDLGYFYGYSFGNMLRQSGGEDIDLDGYMAGLKDALASRAPTLTPEQQQHLVQLVTERRQASLARQAQAEKEMAAKAHASASENLEKAKAFLAENGKKEGVLTTASGLQYQILESGTGVRPLASSRVKVHYEGKLLDGTVFDSSVQRGTPVDFGLNQVIPGWTEGLQLMQVGGRTRFFIPPDLAYGPGGQGTVAPNSLLIFDVELLDVK